MRILFLILTVWSLSSCTPAPDEAASSGGSSKYLYVVSGSCYSGTGNTTFSNTTSSNLVYRLNLSTGQKDRVIADYNAFPSQAGDSPVGIINIDSDYIYVAVENTTTVGARRIEKIKKDSNGARSIFSNNITALSAQLRYMAATPSGDLLVSKSTGIEKFTSAGVRITTGANPFVFTPGGTCSASITIIPKIFTLPSGKIIFLHGLTNQNRIGIVKSTGAASGVAGDCLAGQTSPVNASAFPVAAVYDSTNAQLIVAYASTSIGTDNFTTIMAYPITETSTTATIGTGVEIYDAFAWPSTYSYLLYGISEMALDETNRQLYVTTAISTATTVVNYAIEKFNYNAALIGVTNSSVLTRVGTTPFYPYGIDTKCVAAMMIAN